jgi:Holliday junction resolvase RusA-like endonuclease
MSTKFSVYGIPKPQGSMMAFKSMVVQGGSKEGRAALYSWRSLIVDAARKACPRPMEGPIYITMTFWLPRPKSAHKSIYVPAKKPDLDKLIRAANDALSTILFVDDAQVFDIHAKKIFATAERTPGLDVDAWLAP